MKSHFYKTALIKISNRSYCIEVVKIALQVLFFIKTKKFKCDNMGPTLAIIKSEAGYIFGGFTNLNWDVSNKYVFDSKKSFIFSLTNQSKHLNIS